MGGPPTEYLIDRAEHTWATNAQVNRRCANISPYRSMWSNTSW
ncbi:hypothetical protein [Streptomyces sp. 135]|nr:hypothetical protein [Streptomyces sp. 135]